MARKTIFAPKFRISFPAVFEPKKNDLSGRLEYSCLALFDETSDLSELKKAAHEAAIEKWGANKIPEKLRSPFRDQADLGKKNDQGVVVLPHGCKAGHVYMRFKSTQRPGVVDQNVKPIIDPTELYAGAICIASLSVYAYDAKGNCGVAFGLQNLQKIAEGEPLSGRVKPEDHFAPIANSAPAQSGGGVTSESIF